MTFGAAQFQPICDSTIVTGSTVACRVRSSLSFFRAHAAENGDRRHRQFWNPPAVPFSAVFILRSDARNAPTGPSSFSSSSCFAANFHLFQFGEMRFSSENRFRPGFADLPATSARVSRLILVTIISITSSMLRNATSKPSRICRR